MKFFKKLKSSNFWVSMISAVVLILQAVFNVDIKTEYLNQIILGILGLLVMSGIVTDTPNGEVTVSQSLDIDKIKETLTSMFTQISATFQTDINNVVSQIQNSTQSQSFVETKKEEISMAHEIANPAEEVKQVVAETATIVEATETAVQEIDVPKNES